MRKVSECVSECECVMKAIVPLIGVMSLCYCVTVSLCYCVTVLLCYCVTVLLCHCVTVLLCHCVTVSLNSLAMK